ncbi:MAG: TetR/AcrR family transcriptional regulator [Acidimicrobiales bacterium]
MEAALRLSAEGTLEELSMRGLAEAMGVTPMALYRHVADKDDIMLAVTNERLEQQTLPSTDTPWATYLRELALLMRALLRSEPAVLGVFARRPVTVPAALARLDAAVTVLTRGGFEARDAVRAYAAVHTYTLGFCSLEFARGQRVGGHEVGLSERAAQIASFVTETQFEYGLNSIIDGLKTGVAERAIADPPALQKDASKHA